MPLLANRVRAAQCAPKSASTSEMPKDVAACCTASKSSRQSLRVSISAPSISGRIRGSHFDVVEARGAGAVAGADHLLGLSLAAIRNAPQYPVLAIGDGRAGIPKLGSDAAVGGILEHANAPAILDLPSDLATELEVVALVVGGPAAIGHHINRMAHGAENFVECLFTG